LSHATVVADRLYSGIDIIPFEEFSSESLHANPTFFMNK
jgi:hypothetical protein